MTFINIDNDTSGHSSMLTQCNGQGTHFHLIKLSLKLAKLISQILAKLWHPNDKMSLLCQTVILLPGSDVRSDIIISLYWLTLSNSRPWLAKTLGSEAASWGVTQSLCRYQFMIKEKDNIGDSNLSHRDTEAKASNFQVQNPKVPLYVLKL